jgi:hypothetical protein
MTVIPFFAAIAAFIAGEFDAQSESQTGGCIASRY